MELRRDAQRDVAAQRRVLRLEGLGLGAAGLRVERRRLELEEAAVVEEAPDARRRAGAQLERAAHVGVRDEVELALAVARLHVRQAAELVRQRRQRLGEHLPVVDVHRELALLRALGRAARADDVAGVDPVHEVLERLRRVLVRDEPLLL